MLTKYVRKITLLLLFLMLFICVLDKPVFAQVSVGKFDALQHVKENEAVIDSIIIGDEHLFVLTTGSELYHYHLTKQQWNKVKPIPIQNPNALAAINEHQLMIIGGKANESSGYNENVSYNIQTEAYSTLAPFPTHIQNLPELKAVTLKSHNILVSGSYTLYGEAQPILFEYEVSTNKWTIPYKVNRTSYALEMNATGDVLNFGAGLDQAFVTGLYYSAGEQKYYETSSVPSILSSPATAALNHQFLLASGNQTVGGAIIPSSQAYLFNSKTNQWTSIAPLSTPRVYAKAVALSDQYALVIGGYNKGALNTTELYDAKLNKWTKGPSLNYAYVQPRAHLLRNGKLLVVGQTELQDTYHLAVELMTISPTFLKGEQVISEQAEPNHPGILMRSEQLFSEDNWKYYIQYRYVENSRAVFSNEHFQYTRMYLIRQHQTGKAETLLEGNFSFLKKDGDELYLVESGQLKKLKIGSTYSEAIVYPKTFKKEDSRDTRYGLLGNWSLYEGKPIRIESFHFDGDYIYTWWSSGQYKGFPVKIHYTGQSFRILGSQLATDMYSQLLVNGQHLYYTTGASQKNPSQLIWATIDGQTEKTIASISGSMTLEQNLIYYRDASDPVKNGFGAGKLYVMNYDGSSKRKLDDQGAGALYRTKNGLVYSTYTSDSIKLISGQAIKVLIPSRNNTFYSIHEVNDHYMVYSSYNALTMQLIGTYKFNFATSKSTAYNAHGQAISILLNGQNLTFNEPPILKNGSVMVPFRVILEQLGTSVDYDTKTKHVTATKQQTSVLIKQQSVLVNGKDIKLTQAPFIQNGTTYVPLRFMSEVFGADVHWISDLQSVVIHMK